MASATHPGEILSHEPEARGMSAHRFALELGVPPTRIADLLECRRSVSPEIALGLAACLGGSAKVWPRLQADYRPRGRREQAQSRDRAHRPRRLTEHGSRAPCPGPYTLRPTQMTRPPTSTSAGSTGLSGG